MTDCHGTEPHIVFVSGLRRMQGVQQPRVIVDPETSLEVEVPTFVSDEQAIERARRVAKGEIGVLRMEPEFGCVLPLWDEEGPAQDLEPTELPTALRLDLERWHRRWENGYTFPGGWTSDDEQIAWSTEGERLFRRLEEALWTRYTIEPTFRRMTLRGATDKPAK